MFGKLKFYNLVIYVIHVRVQAKRIRKVEHNRRFYHNLAYSNIDVIVNSIEVKVVSGLDGGETRALEVYPLVDTYQH